MDTYLPVGGNHPDTAFAVAPFVVVTQRIPIEEGDRIASKEQPAHRKSASSQVVMMTSTLHLYAPFEGNFREPPVPLAAAIPFHSDPNI